MIAVSNAFKEAMKQPVKEIRAFIEYDGGLIRDDNDLISFKVSGDGGLCKSVMRKLEAQYFEGHDILGKWITAGFGVRLTGDNYEYINYGSFLVSEFTVCKDTGIVSVVAYDRMINAMIPYVNLSVEYPITLFAYTQKLCEACGLELGNTSLSVNGEWLIERELWENINGITYRDILVQIAQATACICIIGNDNKVYFKPITNTNEELTYDNLFKLKVEEKYGEINSVILSRTPQEDNIYISDEESIQANGLTEFKIENNEILDKEREKAIIPIYNALKGLSYYPFEAATEGLGWYEIGDSFNIADDADNIWGTTLFNFSITVNGSVKETLKAVAETKIQTQYQYATSIAKHVKNTEIIVNKQDQYIKQLVSDMYEENGIVNEKYTQVCQNIDEIVFSVTNQYAGGINCIANSSALNGLSQDWEYEGAVQAIENSEIKNYTVSGACFLLGTGTLKQNIPTITGSTYTLTFKLKKSAIKGWVKVVSAGNEIEAFNTSEAEEWSEHSVTFVAPSSEVTVEICSHANYLYIADMIMNEGAVKQHWTPAPNEVYTTNVKIDRSGIRINNTESETSTVINNTEFAVLHRDKKIITVNKDTTILTKAEVTDEITVGKLKFTPSSDGVDLVLLD